MSKSHLITLPASFQKRITSAYGEIQGQLIIDAIQTKTPTTSLRINPYRMRSLHSQNLNMEMTYEKKSDKAHVNQNLDNNNTSIATESDKWILDRLTLQKQLAELYATYIFDQQQQDDVDNPQEIEPTSTSTDIPIELSESIDRLDRRAAKLLKADKKAKKRELKKTASELGLELTEVQQQLQLQQKLQYNQLLEQQNMSPYNKIEQELESNNFAKIPWNPELGYYLSSRPNFHIDPLYQAASSYYAQDSASQLIAPALVTDISLSIDKLQDVFNSSSNSSDTPTNETNIAQMLNSTEKPLRVLDLCAAPGGKATLLAQSLPPNSLLICSDPDPSRARSLAENIHRQGTPNANVIVVQAYPEEFEIRNVQNLTQIETPPQLDELHNNRKYLDNPILEFLNPEKRLQESLRLLKYPKNSTGHHVPFAPVALREKLAESYRDTSKDKSNITAITPPTTSVEVGFSNFFDVVIVDAPCSGSSMFRKEPQTLKMWSAPMVRDRQSEQREILRTSRNLLQPIGGRLLYMTCSLDYSENHQNVSWIHKHLGLGLHNVLLNVIQPLIHESEKSDKSTKNEKNEKDDSSTKQDFSQKMWKELQEASLKTPSISSTPTINLLHNSIVSNITAGNKNMITSDDSILFPLPLPALDAFLNKWGLSETRLQCEVDKKVMRNQNAPHIASNSMFHHSVYSALPHKAFVEGSFLSGFITSNLQHIDPVFEKIRPSTMRGLKNLYMSCLPFSYFRPNISSAKKLAMKAIHELQLQKHDTTLHNTSVSTTYTSQDELTSKPSTTEEIKQLKKQHSDRLKIQKLVTDLTSSAQPVDNKTINTINTLLQQSNLPSFDQIVKNQENAKNGISNDPGLVDKTEEFTQFTLEFSRDMMVGQSFIAPTALREYFLQNWVNPNAFDTLPSNSINSIDDYEFLISVRPVLPVKHDLNTTTGWKAYRETSRGTENDYMKSTINALPAFTQNTEFTAKISLFPKQHFPSLDWLAAVPNILKSGDNSVISSISSETIASTSSTSTTSLSKSVHVLSAGFPVGTLLFSLDPKISGAFNTRLLKLRNGGLRELFQYQTSTEGTLLDSLTSISISTKRATFNPSHELALSSQQFLHSNRQTKCVELDYHEALSFITIEGEFPLWSVIPDNLRRVYEEKIKSRDDISHINEKNEIYEKYPELLEEEKTYKTPFQLKNGLNPSDLNGLELIPAILPPHKGFGINLHSMLEKPNLPTRKITNKDSKCVVKSLDDMKDNHIRLSKSSKTRHLVQGIHSFVLATYQGIPIGWIQSFGNTFFSLFPTSQRLWKVQPPTTTQSSTQPQSGYNLDDYNSNIQDHDD